MLDKTFSCLYETTAGLTVSAFLICVGVALALGAVTALVGTWRTASSKSFAVTLALLPGIVCVVIMMVNGNLGAGVAVAGAFSLVRFRSAPGSAKEICLVFLAMALGLACGMGYPGFAALFAVVMWLVLPLATLTGFGITRESMLRKTLRITIPEDLDYTGVFDEIFKKYTRQAVLTTVKTTNMGSLIRLTYDITLKQADCEKEMIDALRCRNGNLEISISAQVAGQEL